MHIHVVDCICMYLQYNRITTIAFWKNLACVHSDLGHKTAVWMDDVSRTGWWNWNLSSLDSTYKIGIALLVKMVGQLLICFGFADLIYLSLFESPFHVYRLWINLWSSHPKSGASIQVQVSGVGAAKHVRKLRSSPRTPGLDLGRIAEAC